MTTIFPALMRLPKLPNSTLFCRRTTTLQYKVEFESLVNLTSAWKVVKFFNHLWRNGGKVDNIIILLRTDPGDNKTFDSHK